MRRVFGMETEYSVVMETKSDCKYPFGKGFGASVLLDKLDWAILKPYALQSRNLQRLCVRREQKSSMSFGGVISYWIGATGARVYGDMEDAVLEYASPECDSIEGVMQADKGGERIVEMLKDIHRSGRYRAAGDAHDDARCFIFKNNSDCIRGRSVRSSSFWGSHENYEMPAQLMPIRYLGASGIFERSPFVHALASLLAVRPVLTGAGGLYFDVPAGEWRYAVSPRGLVTKSLYSSRCDMSPKPMVMFKDECDSHTGYIRLQIPVGESNMLPESLRFRFAFVSAFLHFWEDGGSERFSELPLFEFPTDALETVSRDCELSEKLILGQRRSSCTAIDVLLEWTLIFLRYIDVSCRRDELREEYEILARAYSLLEAAEKNPEALVNETDWGLKYSLLTAHCDKKGVGFDDIRSRFIDLWYSETSPTGLYNAWQRKAVRDPFCEEELHEIVWAHAAAPRAELRKRYVKALARRDQKMDRYHGWIFFESPRGPDPESELIPVSDPLVKTAPRDIIARIEKLEQSPDEPVQ